MPIRPELRAFYGKEWRSVIRPRILKRAGGSFDSAGKYIGGARCEQCGVLDRIRAKRVGGAIALALAALRAVERYGVTRHQEQYKGWAKLPAAPAPGAMKPGDALTFIALHSGLHQVNAENFASAYRAAAKRLHPDSGSGNPHLFHILSEARNAVRDAYGWA